MPRVTPEEVAVLVGQASGPVRVVEPLAGDASTRRFFRVYLEGGGSVVAMVFEGPIDPAVHPQVLTSRYFESSSFPVPRLVAAVPESGVLVYEDLGDFLLQEAVRRAPEVDAPEIRRLYEQAVDLIVSLQSRGTRELPADHPAVTSPLDKERFLFELRFFRQHYVEGLRGSRLEPRASEVLDGFFDALAEAASAQPWVLCHRDFHSRNLLVFEGRVRMIDFQDARLGPVAYDLASLLRDSYVALPAALRGHLLETFLELSPGLPLDRSAFRRSFDVVSLQRNLKAIGTFAYQSVVRRKDDYLPYIPMTWSYILETLPRLPPGWEAGEAANILEALSTS